MFKFAVIGFICGVVLGFAGCLWTEAPVKFSVLMAILLALFLWASK